MNEREFNIGPVVIQWWRVPTTDGEERGLIVARPTRWSHKLTLWRAR